AAIINAPVRIFTAGAAGVPATTPSPAVQTSAPPPPKRPGKPTAQNPPTGEELVASGNTGPNGHFRHTLPPGQYRVSAEAFGSIIAYDVDVGAECEERVELAIPVGFNVESFVAAGGCDTVPCDRVRQGQSMYFRFSWNKTAGSGPATTLSATRGSVLAQHREFEEGSRMVREYVFDSGRISGHVEFTAAFSQNPRIVINFIRVVDRDEQAIAGDVTVTMRRAATEATEDLPLWIVIRKSTEALSFNNYQRFLDHVLCGLPLSANFTPFELDKITDPANGKITRFGQLQGQRFLPFTDSEAYRLLKAATEAFVIVNCGVALASFPFDQDDLDYVVRRIGRTVQLDDLWDKYLVAVNGTQDVTLPYLGLILQKLPDVAIKNAIFAGAALPEQCFGILRDKLVAPCLLELIWSYWNEEAMLVQTLNAITRRFQNARGGGTHDPLGNTEIDPLRPLNNLLWGYIQDEQHRLSVVRRNYEYDHHYGLRLEGKAIAAMRAADTRSKFLEAFHNLLRLCAVFFQQDDDTTVVADGFPMLNGLKEVHLILSQGAHNQFGDLPSTARIEMLMQQWLLARPEFREFLPTRVMVAYPEPWMDRVDAMKKIQNWSDVSVLHFRNLAIFGEQILLSIRFGAWSDVNDPAQAVNWGRFWRPEIQGYIHAYRAVTGADLTGDRVDYTMPSVLLRNRLAMQQRSL
ncbi:MAG: carboxypeptidase-like regulatory domain-containing protein, partial [Rhodocyclaceae bacterium]